MTMDPKEQKEFDELKAQVAKLTGKGASLASKIGATGGSDINATLKGMSSLGTEVENLFEKLDAARGSFSSFTGLANEGVPVLRKYSSSVRGLGFDYKESAENLKQLVEGVPDFLNKSEAMQTSMAIQSARLNKLGVDFATNAKNMTTMTKTLGMTDQETMKFNGTLFKFANSLKQPPSVIFKEFGAALPKLIQFGKEAPRVFMQTEVYAKKLGISVESLIDQVSQFDTFEDAAESAGQLNVILGENLFDTQAMLFAEPGEKVQMFVEKMQEFKERTGQSFNDLDRFTQKQFAKSAGMDLDTLKKLSGLNAEEAKELAARKDSVQMTADGSAELQKAAAAATTTVDRLAAKKDQLAGLALPFVDIKTSLEASVTQVEIMTKALIGLAGKDKNVRDAFSAILSEDVTDKMLEGSGIENIKNGLEGVLMKLPGALGTAMQKVIPLIDSAAKDTMLFSKDGIKDVLNRKVGDTNLLEAAGLSDKQIAEAQAALDKKREMITKGIEGGARVLGQTPEQAQKEAELYRQYKEGTGKIILGTADTVTNLAIEVRNKAQEKMKAAEEEAAAKGEQLPIGVNFAKFYEQSFREVFAELPAKLQEIQQGEQATQIKEIGKNLLSFGQVEIGGIFEGLADILGPSGTSLKALSDAAAAGLPVAEQALSGLLSLIQNFNATAGTDLSVLGNNATLLQSGLTALATGAAATAPLGDPALTGQLAAGSANIGTIGSILNSANALPTTGNAVPVYVDGIANSVNGLNSALSGLAPNIGLLDKLKFDSTQAANMKAVGDAMMAYANAVEKTRGLASEQDKIIQVLQGLTNVLAGQQLKVELDAKDLGDAIARGIRGGAAGSTGRSP